MPMLPLSHRPWRGGTRAWALVILWSLAWLAVSPAPTVWSQEPAAKTDAAPAPAPPAPAAEPAGAAAVPDPAAAPAPTGGAEAPKPTSMLMWAIEASGPIGFCLLLLSIYFTALVIRLFMEFRMTEAVPPPLVEKLDAAIKDRKFQEAYDACRDNDSFLARVVRTGVANLPNGRAEAKEAMHDVTEEIVTGMEARISYLAIIGTLGPMIGLVGTIWGMIMSFQVIATAAGRPGEAGGDRRGDLHGAVHHARRGLARGPGDLLPRPLPQPDREDQHGDHQGGRPDDQLAGGRRQAGQDRLTRRDATATSTRRGSVPCRRP